MTITVAPQGVPTTSRVRSGRRRRWRPRRSVVTVGQGIHNEVWVVLGAVGALCAIGLVMVLSASAVTATGESGTPWSYFQRQVVWLGVGVVVMAVASMLDYHKIAKLVPLALLATLVGLLVVLVDSPLSAGARGGAGRWLKVGPLIAQPSEVAKLTLILWIAHFLNRYQRRLHDARATLLPVATVTGVFALLVLVEPDLGGALVLVAIAVTMLVLGGARLDWMGLGVLLLTPLVLWQAFSGYHADRWGFLRPFEDTNAENFQLAGSLTSVANGGVLGVGPGGSSAKWGYVPEAHTDSIFAVIAEDLGIIGCLVVISLYVVLIAVGVRIARRAPDLFGFTLVIGIVSWIGIQAFVNIAVVLGLAPSKGFTLPFVSYGGSSLLMMLAATGLLVSVARSTPVPPARASRSRT